MRKKKVTTEIRMKDKVKQNELVISRKNELKAQKSREYLSHKNRKQQNGPPLTNIVNNPKYELFLKCQIYHKRWSN